AGRREPNGVVFTRLVDDAAICGLGVGRSQYAVYLLRWWQAVRPTAHLERRGTQGVGLVYLGRRLSALPEARFLQAVRTRCDNPGFVIFGSSRRPSCAPASS